MVTIYRHVMSCVEANIIRSNIHSGEVWWKRFADDAYILFLPAESPKRNYHAIDIDDLERDITLYELYKRALARNNGGVSDGSDSHIPDYN